MPIPIPKRPSGYVTGAASALLQIEAFVVGSFVSTFIRS